MIKSDNAIILGTHNSGTCYNLVWWQRPFSWFLHPTSRCQNKTIIEQLNDGVRLFNLQITKYRNRWVFSHGLCIYNVDVWNCIEMMKVFSHKLDKTSPIYLNIYLDKNFITGQDTTSFKEFIDILKKDLECSNVILLYAWVEGENDYIYDSDLDINIRECYWTSTWGKTSNRWIDKLPLPKRHAKLYNKQYKDHCTGKYLMLDFYEI